MNARPRTTRAPKSVRALAATVVAVAGFSGVAVAPAHAALVPADAARSGLFGSTDPTYDAVFRHSLSILALHAAGEPVPAAAISWLKAQQCDDGGFNYFDPTPDGSCRVYDANDWSSGEDVDSTAAAAQALRVVGATDEAQDAEDWIVGQQKPDGGWESPAGSGYGTNVNSSALALMALKAAGDRTPTHDAASFFAGLQLGRTNLGLGTFDHGALAAGWKPNAPNLLATVQGAPGIGGAALTDVPSPAVASWSRDAANPTSTPAATAPAIAGWASAWLADQTNHVDYTGNPGYRAWTILAFATTGTALDAARAQYAKLATELNPANPGEVALATLAATALRETSDAQRFATLTAATLTPATGRDSAAPSRWTLSASSRWVGESVALRNPYTGTTLPLTQKVAWGDGTSSGVSALSTTHAYKSAGTYRPVLTVTYAGHVRSATVTLPAVVVKKDATAPKVTLTKPGSAKKVSAWRTLRGTATDSGSGVKQVTVHLVQQRNHRWYSYNGAAWTERGSYKTALTRAKRVSVTVGGNGAWSLTVGKLAKGTLKVKYAAKDKVGNSSAVRTATAKLTRF